MMKWNDLLHISIFVFNHARLNKLNLQSTAHIIDLGSDLSHFKVTSGDNMFQVIFFGMKFLKASIVLIANLDKFGCGRIEKISLITFGWIHFDWFHSHLRSHLQRFSAGRFVREWSCDVVPPFVPVRVSILPPPFSSTKSNRGQGRIRDRTVKPINQRINCDLDLLTLIRKTLTLNFFLRAGVMKPFFFLAAAACSSRARTSAFRFALSSCDRLYENRWMRWKWAMPDDQCGTLTILWWFNKSVDECKQGQSKEQEQIEIRWTRSGRRWLLPTCLTLTFDPD